MSFTVTLTISPFDWLLHCRVDWSLDREHESGAVYELGSIVGRVTSDEFPIYSLLFWVRSPKSEAKTDVKLSLSNGKEGISY